jgi:hypothetical protein
VDTLTDTLCPRPARAEAEHAEAGPAETGHGGRTCHEVRQDLCRFAVDAATRRPVAALARHARQCAPCGRYVDDVARVRAWLERSAPPAPEFVATAAELAGRARAALARELAARLARDLWDLGHGRATRALELRRQDVRRLLALRGRPALRVEPWPAALRLLLRPGSRPDRAHALKLATRLDPLGLDVALSHVAVLEHRGERAAAELEADRLLGLLG